MGAAMGSDNNIVQELLKQSASVNIQDEVCQRSCTFSHLCKVFYSMFHLWVVCTKVVETL